MECYFLYKTVIVLESPTYNVGCTYCVWKLLEWLYWFLVSCLV